MKISIIFDIELSSSRWLVDWQVHIHGQLAFGWHAKPERAITECKREKPTNQPTNQLNKWKKITAKIEGTRTKGYKIIGFLSKTNERILFSFICFFARIVWISFFFGYSVAVMCFTWGLTINNILFVWPRVLFGGQNSTNLQQRRLHMA